MAMQAPGTWWSGQSNPDGPNESHDDQLTRWVVVGLLVITAAIPLIVGALMYVAFQFGRIAPKVLMGVAALYVLALAAWSGFSWWPVQTYVAVYPAAWAWITGGPALTWQVVLAAQLPFGIALGLVGGAGYTWYRWIRRPVWQEHDLRATPRQWWRHKRAIRDIAHGKRIPLDGVTIGVAANGTTVTLSDTEACAHTFVLGASGSGKTQTLLLGARDAIRRGDAYFYIDLKGGNDVPAALADYAQRYGRRFLHFSIHDRSMPYPGPADGPAYYDPVGIGDPTRRKDLLIGGRQWDMEYYKQTVANYLQTAFKVAALVPPPPGVGSFEDTVTLLQPDRLAERAGQIPTDHPRYAEIYAEVDRLVHHADAQEKSGVRAMQAYMTTFTGSTAGTWLRKDPTDGRDIDLRQAADEGWVVCFSLDSSNYTETAAAIGGLIVQDLKTVSSHLRAQPSHRLTRVVIDEFQALGTDNVMSLIDKCRDAGMPVTISTQAIGNLAAIDEAFMNRVTGVVNSFIIHRANNLADAEICAGLTGQTPRFKAMLNVEHRSSLPGGAVGVGAAVGSGRVEQIDDYVVLPREIQQLRTGEIVFVSRSGSGRVEYPVQVILEDPRYSGAVTPTEVTWRHDQYSDPKTMLAAIHDSPVRMPTRAERPPAPTPLPAQPTAPAAAATPSPAPSPTQPPTASTPPEPPAAPTGDDPFSGWGSALPTAPPVTTRPAPPPAGRTRSLPTAPLQAPAPAPQPRENTPTAPSGEQVSAAERMGLPTPPAEPR